MNGTDDTCAQLTLWCVQTSGVGKTVNRLRKASESTVHRAAGALLKDWKAVASESSAITAPATSQTICAVTGSKRTLSISAASNEKRQRPVPSATPGGTSHAADEHSLDSALATAAVPRKASLKPDFIKPRRPVKSMAMAMGPSAISCSAAVPPAIAAMPASAGGPRAAKGEGHLAGSTEQRAAMNDRVRVDGCKHSNSITACVHAFHEGTPVGTGALPALRDAALSFETEAPRPKKGRRVTWAAAHELVEERSYFCEERGHGLANDFRGQVYHLDLWPTG